jgi:hypothetical protein
MRLSPARCRSLRFTRATRPSRTRTNCPRGLHLCNAFPAYITSAKTRKSTDVPRLGILGGRLASLEQVMIE